MADLRPLHEWSGPPATLTLWRPSMASDPSAPVSPVPPSYEQEQHLRAYRACEQRHEEMARLIIVVWDEPGQCDLQVMGQVVTAHVRRHDTYHSWFEEQGDAIVRRVLTNPAAIEMEATTLGEVTAEDWQLHVAATRGPFDWDCFRFGVLQRATGFTCVACIDHLHSDSSVIAFLMDEIHARYRALIDGQALPPLDPPGLYLDYCANQRRRAATTMLSDPKVTQWVAFLHRNHGRMPPFRLPLGALEDRCLTEHLHVDILDAAGMAAFESACHSCGARVIGGLLACAALTERELAGGGRYSVVTPTTTRRSRNAFRTSGWCIGLVPIDLDVDEGTFPELAVAAQHIFDERLSLASVPIERVLELAHELPTIRPVATGGVMLSYMDMGARLPSLSAQIPRDWHQVNGRVYINRGMGAQVAIWFFRTQRGLTLTVAYPATATARASMQRYVNALRHACSQAVAACLQAADA